MRVWPSALAICLLTHWLSAIAMISRALTTAVGTTTPIRAWVRKAAGQWGGGGGAGGSDEWDAAYCEGCTISNVGHDSSGFGEAARLDSDHGRGRSERGDALGGRRPGGRAGARVARHPAARAPPAGDRAGLGSGPADA